MCLLEGLRLGVDAACKLIEWGGFGGYRRGVAFLRSARDGFWRWSLGAVLPPPYLMCSLWLPPCLRLVA